MMSSRYAPPRRVPTLIVLILMGNVFTVVAGCGQDLGWGVVMRSIRAEYPAVPQLATDSLAAWLNAPADERPVLLDVRTPAEFAVSHLPGARRVDPDAPIPPFLEEAPRDLPIVAYCSVGYRSSGLVDRLQAAGFTNVHNLEGSIFAWANEGLPVYRGAVRTDRVHPYDRVWGRLLDAPLRADVRHDRDGP